MCCLTVCKEHSWLLSIRVLGSTALLASCASFFVCVCFLFCLFCLFLFIYLFILLYFLFYFYLGGGGGRYYCYSREFVVSSLCTIKLKQWPQTVRLLASPFFFPICNHNISFKTFLYNNYLQINWNFTRK